MSALVSEAREWIGTPFVHQGRSKGAGCDCLGLVAGVLSKFGDIPEIPLYSSDWDFSDKLLFYRSLSANLNQKYEAFSVGDLIGFALRRNGPLQHVGILSQVEPTPRFIHSYSTYGVVESALTDAWQRRIVARFELPFGD